MVALLLDYGLICLASLAGNLGIEAMRLLSHAGAPAWADRLNWAFTVILTPPLAVLTLPVWLMNRRTAPARR